MTRFEELTKLFDPWHDRSTTEYRESQTLASRIAKHLQIYLGCPETFQDLHPDSKEKERYVSPTRAIFDDPAQKFTLRAHNDLLPDLDTTEDGYFHFGLRVFLESAPNTYPKHPFWFLLRGRFDGARFHVTVLRSKREFEIGFQPPLTLDPLCEHLFELLKEDLSKSPMIGPKEPSKIGFVT